MRLLLDTHTLIWWLLDSPRLSRAAYAAIESEENEVFVSAASAWEVTTKHRLGRLSIAGPLALDFSGEILREGFQPLEITVAHAQDAGALPGTHADPFDRMLIAQALAERMALVSNESTFDQFGVTRIW